MLYWQGGARAVGGTLGYATAGEMALGATGVGVLVVGGTILGTGLYDLEDAIHANMDIQLINLLAEIRREGYKPVKAYQRT